MNTTTKVINAICFNCGAEKSSAIKLCNECREMPTSYEDRVVSVCLSKDCLRQENLARAAKYMQTKNRLPGFYTKVRRKAEQIVGKMPDTFQVSQSIDLSASFFEERFVLED